jgi:hypothetical protein
MHVFPFAASRCGSKSGTKFEAGANGFAIYEPNSAVTCRGLVGGDSGWCRLGGDFFVDAEVLFDGGDALKGVIDFFLEADDVLDFFSEFVQITADGIQFPFNARQLFGEIPISPFVAMWSTTCLSISPSSLSVVSFPAICGKYSTRVGRVSGSEDGRGCQASNMEKSGAAAGIRFAI